MIDAGPRPGPWHSIAAPARCCAAAVVLPLLLLLPAGCGMDADFDNAARSNTTVAWDEYLRAHPDGPHAREARARLAALLEDREWQRAHVADTADSYQRYLRSYPQGAHAHDALVAIASLNLVRAPPGEAAAEPPPSNPAAGTIAREAAAAPPASAPAEAAPAPPGQRAATPAGFRVQLGAFADGGAAAERVWRDLVGRHPELAGRTPLIVAARAVDGRAIYRLQIAGFERAGAEALCRTLAADKDPCVAIPPLEAAAAPR